MKKVRILMAIYLVFFLNSSLYAYDLTQKDKQIIDSATKKIEKILDSYEKTNVKYQSLAQKFKSKLEKVKSNYKENSRMYAISSGIIANLNKTTSTYSIKESSKKNINLSKLIKSTDYNNSYKGKILDRLVIGSYNIDNFEKDIKVSTKTSIYDWYENYIQEFSKKPEFIKQDFINVFKEFENGNLEKIKDIFNSKEYLNPSRGVFSGKYISHIVYRNGIIGLSKGGNGGITYTLSYTTFENKKINYISKDGVYHIENGYLSRESEGTFVNIKKVDDEQIFTQNLIKNFKSEVKDDEIFLNELNLFKEQIDDLYN